MSLLPSATEIVCALGLRDRLVGVSHECDYPVSVSELPRLTASILDHGLSPAEIDQAVLEAGLSQTPLYSVDGQLLTQLAPELIVTQGVCAVCAVTEHEIADSLRLVSLEASSSANVLSLRGVDFETVLMDILAVGEMTGVFGRAESLVADLRRDWAALPGEDSDGPRVLMMEWTDPPWLGGHWVPEQVAAAGGVDVFGIPGAPSRRLTWEAIFEADPDVVVVMGCGHSLEENLVHAREAFSRADVSALRAYRTGQIWATDANSIFSRPGPRIVEGAQVLSRIFKGDPVPMHLAQPIAI